MNNTANICAAAGPRTMCLLMLGHSGMHKAEYDGGYSLWSQDWAKRPNRTTWRA